MFKYSLQLILFTIASLSQIAATAPHAMVVSEQYDASHVGREILTAGGNAIDAAVAMAYALAVVNPCCGNIGGGGFMLIHLKSGKNIFINFREAAPLKATANMYLGRDAEVEKNKALQGYLAVGVPGTVLGLETARKKYGTMSRQTVMAPAILLAKDGYIVTQTDARQFAENQDAFKAEANVASIFLKNNMPLKKGDKLRQPGLARTLSEISLHGAAAFYRGRIAKEIVDASNQHGGILTIKDFENYHVSEPKPVYCHYRQYTIVSAPLPSSGGTTLCEILNILENLPIHYYGLHSSKSIRYIIEAMGYAYADRNQYLGDPDFVVANTEKLLDKRYAKTISEKILSSQFTTNNLPSITYHEKSDTTHLSVVDKDGNAVSLTYSLNGFFGAKVMAGDTGFFLNNVMDDFSLHAEQQNKFGLVHSSANAIAPGKRPLSSMTPVMVFKNQQLYIVTGSPGGSRIITSVLLTLLNILDGSMNIQTAISVPRFHYQHQPNVVELEAGSIPFLSQMLLKLWGYSLVLTKPWGAVETIMIAPQNGGIIGANDPRRPAGAALGY